MVLNNTNKTILDNNILLDVFASVLTVSLYFLDNTRTLESKDYTLPSVYYTFQSKNYTLESV